MEKSDEKSSIDVSRTIKEQEIKDWQNYPSETHDTSFGV